MKLLAIDTSTEACSASLLHDGDTGTRYKIAPRRHAELILPMVRDLLETAGLELQQLDALVFGQGPGAFTGVRIAAGIIQGLAYSHDLPVIPVSSLATLAQSQAGSHERIMPAFDARMDEIYYGFYTTTETGTVQAIGDEGVAAPGAICVPDGSGWHGIGSGWDRYHDLLLSRPDSVFADYTADAFPSAEHMIPLAVEKFDRGEMVGAEYAQPVYLRNQVTGMA